MKQYLFFFMVLAVLSVLLCSCVSGPRNTESGAAFGTILDYSGADGKPGKSGAFGNEGEDGKDGEDAPAVDFLIAEYDTAGMELEDISGTHALLIADISHKKIFLKDKTQILIRARGGDGGDGGDGLTALFTSPDDEPPGNGGNGGDGGNGGVIRLGYWNKTLFEELVSVDVSGGRGGRGGSFGMKPGIFSGHPGIKGKPGRPGTILLRDASEEDLRLLFRLVEENGLDTEQVILDPIS